MSSTRKPPARGRPPLLDTDRVVAAAVECIARSNLDALTIRAVAAELGSSPMALYRYVADRDELVARAVDRILGQVELPPHPTRVADRGRWLVTMAHETRRVLVEYPGVAELLLVMGPTGEQGYAFMDRICHVLADTGRDPEEVAFAYTWLMVTVAAYAARYTRSRDIAGAEGVRRGGLRDMFVERTLPFAEQYPHLASVAGQFTIDPERSFGDAIDHVVADIVRRHHA